MDLRQLRYFEAVARHRHFTRAADELHVAQSAVSHQVQRLERELGIELLRRTTRSVEPTEAGTLVAARARAVLAESEALLGEVEELRGLVRGRLTVGALLFGGELDIPAILAAFTSAFPHVEVGVREGTAQRMLDMLRDGSLDVAFALEKDRPEEVEGIGLSREELTAAISPRHPLAGDAPLRVERLADHALIAFQPGSSTRAMVDAALARAGVQTRVAVEANDLALVRSMAARGLGVAVLPRSFAELPGPRVTVRPLQPTLRMEVVLWWLRDRRLSPAARAFVEFTAARARRQRPARGSTHARGAAAGLPPPPRPAGSRPRP
jgi:DNA-binding transcriptional LysR family regulator